MYFKNKKCNLDELYYYGKLFKVTSKLQSYIEVLTWGLLIVLKVKLKRFLYASEISYASTNNCLYELLRRIDIWNIY